MLLIIEALLLILAFLGQDHRTAVEGQIYPLDMAKNSVDDQFEGGLFYQCTKKMENRVNTEFMRKEMTSSDFANAWNNAVMYHTPPAPGDNLSKNHSVAIYLYTNSKSNNFNLYERFNNAVRTGKQEYIDGTYSWYSLHFWLTEAIQILKETQTDCYNTYRGTNVEYNKTVKGNDFRFGQFALSSLDRSIAARKFGAKSCFEVRTCEGADVTKYSRFPEEKEVLIAPYETFTVTDVKSRAEQKDLWCDTVYTLKSYATKTYMNCAVANSGNQVAFLKVLFILIVFCSLVNY